MSQKLVFVGLSGGVDSSVAALRLIRRGYKVVGVFIKVWHPDWLKCNWEAERLDAMRVAAHLGIPFMTCDAEEAYKRGVADYFISEYVAGRTPNPDVMCNREVKFGAFLEFARSHKADYIATGHYAQVVEEDGTFSLLRGLDTQKDQSYFLWTLNQSDLAQVLLPVGDSTKDAIRKVADGAKLLTAEKKDSQGVCFLGHIDIAEFLSHYTTLKEGAVLGTDGTVIGRHAGALIYTTGQRHGFSVDAKSSSTLPHYVVARDIAMNTITVSTEKPVSLPASTVRLTNCNWIEGIPDVGSTLSVQTRYRQTPRTVAISEVTSDTATLEFVEEADTPSLGQSCVIYSGTHCLGGGIIS